MRTPTKSDIVEIEFSSSQMVMRKTPLVWHSHLFHSCAQCCQLSMLWMELFAEVRIETDWEVQICSAIWKKLYFIEGWQERNLRCFFSIWVEHSFKICCLRWTLFVLYYICIYMAQNDRICGSQTLVLSIPPPLGFVW